MPTPRPPDLARATGLLAGLVADALLGDPQRFHPVAGFGKLAAAAERLAFRPRRAVGAAFLLGLLAPVCVGTRWTERRLGPGQRWAFTAVTAWTVIGGRSLHRSAARIQQALEAGDVEGARRLLPALCGRDPARLDADGITRAVIESVAENTSDAVVAPLLWGALAGTTGLAGYRAVNTLDAMVGHPTPRLAHFGWASARADDLANLVPARITASLATVSAPLLGGRPAAAWRAWQRDGSRHPSPNAGPCEGAFAGALDVRLGGQTIYLDAVSARPVLGNGHAAQPHDIARAVRLSRIVIAAAAVITAAIGAYR